MGLGSFVYPQPRGVRWGIHTPRILTHARTYTHGALCIERERGVCLLFCQVVEEDRQGRQRYRQEEERDQIDR